MGRGSGQDSSAAVSRDSAVASPNKPPAGVTDGTRIACAWGSERGTLDLPKTDDIQVGIYLTLDNELVVTKATRVFEERGFLRGKAAIGRDWEEIYRGNSITDAREAAVSSIEEAAPRRLGISTFDSKSLLEQLAKVSDERKAVDKLGLQVAKAKELGLEVN